MGGSQRPLLGTLQGRSAARVFGVRRAYERGRSRSGACSELLAGTWTRTSLFPATEFRKHHAWCFQLGNRPAEGPVGHSTPSCSLKSAGRARLPRNQRLSFEVRHLGVKPVTAPGRNTRWGLGSPDRSGIEHKTTHGGVKRSKSPVSDGRKRVSSRAGPMVPPGS